MDDLYAKLKRHASQPHGPGPQPELANALPDWRGEYARDHGLEGRVGPGFVTEDDAGLGDTGDLTWQEELLRELAAPTKRRSARSIVDGGEPMLPKWLDGVPLPPNPAGFKASLIPRDDAAYRVLLHQVFDRPKRQLIEDLARLPVMRGAFEAWEPGKFEQNANIARELAPRLKLSMAERYVFRPADMVVQALPGGISGMYADDVRMIYLNVSLFHLPVRELVATIIHEQVHKLQFEMMWRLTHRAIKPLSHQERALAMYWIADERSGRRRKATLALAQGKGDRAYRAIATEYHAFDTEESALGVLEKLFG